MEERRGRAKESASEHDICRRPSREGMSSALERVWTTAKLRKKERLTALPNHVTIELLRDAYSWLKRDAAIGVYGVTWDDYGTDLEANLADLHARIHRGAYRAQPPRRVYIPKPDGRGARSALSRWKIRLFSARLPNCSTQSRKKTSSGFRTPSGGDAASTMRWIPLQSGSRAGR